MSTVKERIDAIVAEVQDARDSASASVSTQSRTMSLGVLAVVWLLLGGTQQALTEKFSCYTNPLIIIAALCVISLALDFLQYVFTYFDTSSALDDSLQAKVVEDAGFNEGSLLSKLTMACFFAKMCVSGLASGWLLLIMFGALTGR